MNTDEKINESLQFLKPLTLNLREKIVKNAIENVVNKKYKYTKSPAGDILILIDLNKINNDYVISDITKECLNIQDSIIESETNESATNFNRNFILFESNVVDNILTIKW